MLVNQVRLRGEEAMLAVCNCNIPSVVILSEYERLENKFDRLPKDEIESMWEYVGSRFPDKTREEKIKCCKIIHCFGELL